MFKIGVSIFVVWREPQSTKYRTVDISLS